ncbi:hypothetical protein [Agromyces bauzanensis]|uniref:Uncharacterized protein n=1 Tax=Agromyces bauzanensis TaxID=1308924 RepID=A0A917PPA3_9MICO|nr:hypothetical protein [Agromyces bauzanensis]GGJ86978.1 hypothetical protein GCM10011372_26750 [Agromyces bauzanensis]
MAESMSAERRQLTAKLLGTITRLGIDRHLKVTGVDGSKPIVIAFGDESIGDVFERVAWSAGFANVFVVMSDDDIALVSVLPPASSLVERESEPLELLSPDSPIEMLVEASRKVEGGGFNIRIAKSTAKIDAVEDAARLVGVS